MWQILLITAYLAQVSADGVRTECQAGMAELRELLHETRAQFQTRINNLEGNEVKLQNRITTSEIQLQERIANEAKLQERITDLEQRLDAGTSQSKTVVVSPYIYSTYGCFQDTISLSCPDARTIFITSAIYGQFLQTCSHQGIACCPPNPIDDCVEDVETSNPQDWFAIKYLCDNRTSCEFVNGGGYVPSCDAQSLIDYMTVSYQCLPENGTVGAIAFTAYADATRDYGEHETILFNKVLSNIGGGYDTVSSMFTCPVSGVYVISLTVTSFAGDKRIQGEIFKEASRHTAALADDHINAVTSGFATSVLSCKAGERIWVRSYNANSEMLGSNDCCRKSSMSGFLLYAN